VDNCLVDVGAGNVTGGHAGDGFVGRERELGELLAGLDEVAAGRGCVFLIGGEPGIGKSRLADELTRRARERGTRVVWGRCWEAGGAPTYWPWVQALRGYVRNEDPETLRRQLGAGAAELAQIVPEIREVLGGVPAPTAGDPDDARFRLFDATSSFLRAAGTARPLLIVLDDLGAADTPSLLLLQFVTGDLAESRVMIVGSHRDPEAGSAGALATTIAELDRQGVTHRLHVGGLAQPDVARLVELTAGRLPPRAVVAAVHRETEGNPLFVGEVVRLLMDEGRLDTAVGEPLSRLAIPQRVRDVIERRLDRLSDGCRRLLVLASVIGREFGLDALARVSDLAGDALLEVLDEAADARVVTDVPGALGRLRFSHALIRDSLYDGMPTARRIRLHRRLAEALEDLYAGDVDAHLAELAHHFFAAAPGGDVDRAIDYARRAGDRAVALYGYEDATRLYRMAIEALTISGARHDGPHCDLLLALGEAQDRAGELAAARATFLDAASIARRCALPRQLAAAAVGYGGRWVWARPAGDPHLIPLLEDALALLGEENSPERVKLLARLACAHRSDKDRETAAGLSTQAVAIARRLGDPTTLAYALDAHYGATFWYDNTTERLALCDEQLAVAHESGNRERILHALAGRASALLELGRIADAEADVAEVSRIAGELRQPAQQWIASSTRAMLALLRGDLDVAERLVREELRVGGPAMQAHADTAFCAHDAWLRKERGELDGLEAAMRRAAEAFPWYAVYRCLVAELYVEVGRKDDARRLLDELAADDFAPLLPRDNMWLAGATTLADVCAALGDTARARALYDMLLPVAHLNVVAWPEMARGSAARSLAVLAAAMGRGDEAESHFRTALEANARMGARPWLARTQYEYGRLLLARDGPGDRATARELLDRALDTARALGLAPLVTRIGMLGGATPAADRLAETGVLRREGEYWSVEFGGDAFRVRDAKGMRYLARLLAAPGQEIHALDLVGAEAGPADRRGELEPELTVAGVGDAGDLLDDRAKATYRQRIADLRDDIDEADAWNDPERAARAREELEFIERELSAAVGLGGRSRKAASAAERARVNVTRATKAAMARLGDHSPALGAHLEQTVRTGTFCSYAPDPRAPISWRT
jgi:tetratricopeptide (TPR) repeat protein